MLQTIIKPRPGIGQDKLRKPRPSEYIEKAAVGSGYLTLELFANNELRYTFNNKLTPKNNGDTSIERNLECQGRQLDVKINRLRAELIDKKIQLFKLNRIKKTKGSQDIWQKKATLELEIREIEATLTGANSELFLSPGERSLGITNKLQDCIKSYFGHLSDSVLNCNQVNFLVLILVIKFLIFQFKSLIVKKDTKENQAKENRPTKFTKLARHRFLEYGQVIEDTCGKNAYFITLTCPGDTVEVYQALSRYSSYIDNRLTQVIRDNKKFASGNIFDLACWEFHKSGKLHKHIVIASDDVSLMGRKFLYSLAKKITLAWERILDDMATTKRTSRGKFKNLPGIDMYQRDMSQVAKGSKYDYVTSWRDYKKELHSLGHFVNIQKVKKSVAGYLSKYCSKSELPNKSKNKVLYFPSRWHNACQSLKDMAAAQRLKVIVPICPDILDMMRTALKSSEKNVKYWHKVHWDIYAQLDSKNKAKRINRKPWEPRPANSIRVSNGCKMIMYFHKAKFAEVREIVTAIVEVCNAVNSLPDVQFKGSRIGKISEKETAIQEKYQYLRKHWRETVKETMERVNYA